MQRRNRMRQRQRKSRCWRSRWRRARRSQSYLSCRKWKQPRLICHQKMLMWDQFLCNTAGTCLFVNWCQLFAVIRGRTEVIELWPCLCFIWLAMCFKSVEKLNIKDCLIFLYHYYCYWWVWKINAKGLVLFHFECQFAAWVCVCVCVRVRALVWVRVHFK